MTHPLQRLVREPNDQRLRRGLLTVALGLAGCWLASPSFGQNWTLTAAESTLDLVPGIHQTVWNAEPGPTEFDVIGLHRYRDPGTTPRAVLFYLPGTNMNGVLTLTSEQHNLWLWLARRGVVVYALNYRTNAIPPSRVDNFEFMQSWTMDSFVDDARSALEHARKESPGLPVFAAGFSRGAALAFGLACVAEPGHLAGLVALDGGFKNVDAIANAAPESLSDALAQMGQAGPFHSDVAAGIGWEGRDQLMQSVTKNPDGPASQDGYDTIGTQLAQLLYQAWGPGRLAHPIGASTGRGLSKPEVLAQSLAGYDRYYPAAQNVDGRLVSAVKDHPETAIDDCFGSLDMPFLFFGSSGMGSDWLLNGIFTAQRSGSKEVELHVLEGYGHLDVLVAETAVVDVFEPVLRFIERQLP